MGSNRTGQLGLSKLVLGHSLRLGRPLDNSCFFLLKGAGPNFHYQLVGFLTILRSVYYASSRVKIGPTCLAHEKNQEVYNRLGLDLVIHLSGWVLL